MYVIDWNMEKSRSRTCAPCRSATIQIGLSPLNNSTTGILPLDHFPCKCVVCGNGCVSFEVQILHIYCKDMDGPNIFRVMLFHLKNDILSEE